MVLTTNDSDTTNVFGPSPFLDWISNGATEEVEEPDLSEPPAPVELDSRPVAVPAGWPVLGKEAYQGPMGEAVEALAPFTEADPAAILVTLMAQAGAVMGRSPYIDPSERIYRSNMFALIIGPTSDGKKGTSFEDASRLLGGSSDFYRISGLVSGEAVIARAGDEEGAGRKAIIIEPEFARMLEVMGRNGSTLGEVVRELFDGGPLSRSAKDEEVTITDYHIGLVAHITPMELRAKLSSVDQANGMANRHLMIASHSRQKIWFYSPDGRSSAYPTTTALLDRARKGQTRGRIPISPSAVAVMKELHLNGALSSNSPLLARLWVHFCRMTLIFAVMDDSAKVEERHVNAALAIARYSEKSVEHFFEGQAFHSPVDQLYKLILDAGENGLTDTEILAAYSNHMKAVERDEYLRKLTAENKILTTVTKGSGRPMHRHVSMVHRKADPAPIV